MASRARRLCVRRSKLLNLTVLAVLLWSFYSVGSKHWNVGNRGSRTVSDWPKASQGHEDIATKTDYSGVPSLAQQQTTESDLPLCPAKPPGLWGRKKPSISFPDEGEVEQELNLTGGCWRPSCRPPNGSIAILFPSHGRRHHLLLTLKYLVPLLQRQRQDFCIFAGEQAPGSAGTRFNKGATVDALFMQAMAERNWSCVCAHDVDLIPQDDRLSYSCPVDHVRHLPAAIDKWGYRLPYPLVFGGGTISMSEHFIRYNGLSTAFWGWGTEDDDHRQRIGWAGLRWKRFSDTIARFSHIPHPSSTRNPDRFWFARNARSVWQDYGLKTLRFKVVKTERKKLYTRFTFQFPKQGRQDG